MIIRRLFDLLNVVFRAYALIFLHQWVFCNYFVFEIAVFNLYYYVFHPGFADFDFGRNECMKSLFPRMVKSCFCHFRVRTSLWFEFGLGVLAHFCFNFNYFSYFDTTILTFALNFMNLTSIFTQILLTLNFYESIIIWS